MKRLLAVVLAAAMGVGSLPAMATAPPTLPPPPPSRRPPRSARCATPSASPRPGSTRRGCPTCTRAIVTAHLFEGLYHYDHLARPVKIKPLTAAAMPEISADFRRFTIRLRPGIRFADDEAFKGKGRELVAQDYVYALKRFADPASKSPGWSEVAEMNFVGLARAAPACAGRPHAVRLRH